MLKLGMLPKLANPRALRPGSKLNNGGNLCGNHSGDAPDLRGIDIKNHHQSALDDIRYLADSVVLSSETPNLSLTA